MMMMKMMINVAGFWLKFEQPLERLIGTKRERERERERENVVKDLSNKETLMGKLSIGFL